MPNTSSARRRYNSSFRGRNKIAPVLQGVVRGFKTLAVKRKGNVAGKLAKQLKETRGATGSIAGQRRAQRKHRARRLLK